MGYKLKKIFIRNVNPEYRNLPSEYQQVEYIASSGGSSSGSGVSPSTSPYIDTQYKRTSNYGKTKAKFEITGGNSTQIFRGSNDGTNIYTFHINPNFQFSLGSNTNQNVATKISGRAIDVEFIANSGSYSINIDGTSYTGSYTGSVASNTRNIYLFNTNENNYSRPACIKLYYLQMYSDADTLVRDLVPCYRKADDVIGMYDLVNDTFYTNSGTGTFTKGSDIPHMEEIEIYPGGQSPEIEISIEFYNYGSTAYDGHVWLSSVKNYDTSKGLILFNTSYQGRLRSVDFVTLGVEQLFSNVLSTYNTWWKFRIMFNRDTGERTCNAEDLNGNVLATKSGTDTGGVLTNKQLYFLIGTGGSSYPYGAFRNLEIKIGDNVWFSDSFTETTLSSTWSIISGSSVTLNGNNLQLNQTNIGMDIPYN